MIKILVIRVIRVRKFFISFFLFLLFFIEAIPGDVCFTEATSFRLL